jgi:Tol biopolymer transport system component
VPALVTDAFTGQVIAAVHPPGGASFAGVAAAGDDRTFVLAAQTANGPDTRYYELRLGPTGRPRPLVLLPVPATVHGGSVVFAVSADASRLAIATGTAGNAQIEVISLATGAVRSWRAAGGYATDLSWAAGRTLAFEWWDSSRPSSAAEARSGVRLLDTAAPGTDLLASRFIIPRSASTSFGTFSGLDYPLISPDGSKVFATMVSGQPSNPVSEVVEFSARTGRALAVVTPPSGESGTGRWCGVLWVGPSGAHLTAVCGIEGRADNGQFTQMNLHVPSYNFSIPRDSFIAW